ncbi:hypothetical protein [Chitinophaga sp.]
MYLVTGIAKVTAELAKARQTGVFGYNAPDDYSEQVKVNEEILAD